MSQRNRKPNLSNSFTYNAGSIRLFLIIIHSLSIILTSVKLNSSRFNLDMFPLELYIVFNIFYSYS
eukprot:UN22154